VAGFVAQGRLTRINKLRSERNGNRSDYARFRTANV